MENLTLGSLISFEGCSEIYAVCHIDSKGIVLMSSQDIAGTYQDISKGRAFNIHEGTHDICESTTESNGVCFILKATRSFKDNSKIHFQFKHQDSDARSVVLTMNKCATLFTNEGLDLTPITAKDLKNYFDIATIDQLVRML